VMTSYQENKQPNSLLSVDCTPIAVVATLLTYVERLQ